MEQIRASLQATTTNNTIPPKHFVLIHGFGHGAWCWYKVIPLLQKAGHTVTALDLASNGISKVPASSVTSIADYVRPLTQLLASLTPHDPKVVLVGHSLGGSSISYAMELFPHKISIAIFIAAFMPTTGSAFFPTWNAEELLGMGKIVPHFTEENQVQNGDILATSKKMMKKKKLVSVSVNPEVIPDFYNQSPSEDICLAHTCLNPTPVSPFSEVLSLTDSNYGSIPRYFIRTDLDKTMTVSMQATILEQNPPHKVFTLPQSDHFPFFSDPSNLVDILLSIAAVESIK